MTAATTAKSVVRESGTASPFQMPPRLARLPSVPRPGSARAAKAVTPSACDEDNDSDTIAATSHGSAATTATPSAAAAQNGRGQPGPGASEQTNATVAASIRPVGVNPASAIQKASAHNSCHRGPDSDVRRRSIVAATHGRHPQPSRRLQCPCNRRSAT